MEKQKSGKRQRGSEAQSGKASTSTLSTEDEPVHRDAFDPRASLTDQCNHCHRKLEHCIVQAQQVGVNIARLSRLESEPFEQQLREYKLKFDIWSADCGVNEGHLEHVGRQAQSVRRIFEDFSSHLEAIANDLNESRKDVKTFEQRSSASTPASVVGDPLTDERMFKLRVTCDKITGSLLELFELQPLIQTAQALGQVGPQRELRNNILHIKQQYQLQASSESTENSMLSAGRAGFDDDDLEHCPHCDQWFAFGTLDFHQDLCSEIIVQKEDFAPRESRSKEKPRGRKKLRELEEAEATKAPSMDTPPISAPKVRSSTVGGEVREDTIMEDVSYSAGEATNIGFEKRRRGDGRSKIKCQVCRTQKKKCEPENRRWDENGGIQEKCTLCKTSDYACDAGSKLSKPTRMSSPLKRQKSTMQHVEGSELEPNSDGDMQYALGGGIDNKSGRRRRLKERMKCLDCYKEIFTQCCNKIGYLENMKAQFLPHHPYENSNDTSDILEISQAQSAAREQLLVTLAEVRMLAGNVVEDGDPDAAECAYLRAVKVFETPPLNGTAVYLDLLREVGSFFLKNGDNLQAEKHLQKIFNLPHLSEDVEADTLQSLAKSTQTSTEEIGKVYRSGELGRLKRGVQDPFPQSHRFITAISATESRISTATMTLEWRIPDITGSPLLHSAILSRNAHAIDMIRSCPHKELLENRDVYKRTALFLAALTQAEDVGFSIMNRFADQPANARERLMNARDLLGNTILAISILSKCSTPFIEATIDNGSEADPLQVEGGYTPLQAAALMGRLDVFEILQDHGAKDREPQLGKPNALQLAQNGKHSSIFERLINPT